MSLHGLVIDERLQKHFLNFDVYLRRARKEVLERLDEELKITVSLEDFKIYKLLGTGSFGKVVLCKYKDEESMYAMKLMEKVNVVRTKQIVHTIAEIRILDAIRFPFIIHLEYFFKNNVYLFIVMPFINGGEMFYHLRSVKKFDENLSKFYAAQVIMSLEFLHYMGIIYRDLKPENILIDSTGYLKIADLGFCKKIDNHRTYTLCGTPEYLAPEIILSKGYSFAVDWWSFGILIFEMCAGFPPFFSKDHMKLYEKIVNGKFLSPSHFSRSLKDLTDNILQVDRSKRYGGLKWGSKQIKAHDWFRNVNFDLILQQKVKPTYLPQIDSPDDTKYFDSHEAPYFRQVSYNEYEEEFQNLDMKKK